MNNVKKTKEYLTLVSAIEKVLKTLEEGDNVKIIYQQAKEEEGEDMLVVSHMMKGYTTRQCYRMGCLWEEYQKGTTVEALTMQIAQAVEYYQEVEKRNPVDSIHDYDKIKKRLIVRPKNYPKNQERLDIGVCEIVGDIALALYVNMGSFQEVYSSFMIPKSLLKVWKKTKEEVLEDARRNTLELFPPRTYEWYDGLALKERVREFMSEEGGRNFHNNPWGVFISNDDHINGAVSVFLPGVARRLAQLMECDFYIGFTSMHEAVIHGKDSVTPREIAESLKDLNISIPAPEDFLSEKVYYYSCETDQIALCP